MLALRNVIGPVVAMGACALFWGGSVMAAAAGTSDAPPSKAVIAEPAAAVTPSIEILPSQSQLAGTCGGATFDLSTFINVDAQASADVKLTVAGAGTIEQFVDETGSNIGPFRGPYSAFHILSFGGGLPPNTAVKLSITTYPGHGLSGKATFVSTVTFDCTTGVILNLAADPPNTAPPVPALGDTALIAMAVAVALFGAAALRRRDRKQVVRSRRSTRRP
jgi:IPTL-CTERM motif